MVVICMRSGVQARVSLLPGLNGAFNARSPTSLGAKNPLCQPGGLQEGHRSGLPRVLVIEDEALVAMEIAQILCDAGFEVVGPAGKVDQALQLLSDFGCDAAVLDIRLGGETSEPIARMLAGRSTPFVLVSGYAEGRLPRGFENAALLTKPLRSELLVEHLRWCIARKATNHFADSKGSASVSRPWVR
jgi:DNA-binding response OmpR family regulator